jgi:hypothetical protein
LPEIGAAVRTRVVSWNAAAEMNESVESDAFVIPQQHRPALRRAPAVGNHALVLLHEAEGWSSRGAHAPHETETAAPIGVANGDEHRLGDCTNCGIDSLWRSCSE